MEPVIGLRERTRQAVRAELVQVALGLFLEDGFEATTVEQIATAAGLSRRSFHRYFATKDDVLSQALSFIGDKIAEELSGRPTNEPPWTALRRAFDSLTARMSEDPRALPLTRIMLRSSAHDVDDSQTSWQQSLATVLLRRPVTLDAAADQSLQADALAASAIACMRAAQKVWVESGGEASLSRLLDLAMSAVAPIHDT